MAMTKMEASILALVLADAGVWVYDDVKFPAADH